MNRQHVALAAIALLSVFALSVAAANLDANTESSPGVGVGSTEVGIGSDESFSFGGSPAMAIEEPSEEPFYRLLSQLIGLFIVLGAIVGIVTLYKDYGVKGPLSVVGVGVFLALIVYFMISGWSWGANEGTSGFGRGEEIKFPGGGSLGDVDAVQVATQPAVSTAFAIILGIVLVLALLAYTQSSRSEAEDEPVPGTPKVDVAEIGAVAGRAARRIERNGGEPENEVFRAWKAMTDHLDLPNPATSTPTEFANAAIDAGMKQPDVDELTRLFEDVRYGGEAPTDERESRAVSALKRIERAYSEEPA